MEQIGKTMEVYVDDMLVKLKTIVDHVAHISDTFAVLRNYQMKLNLLKCEFGVASEKFLSFMVNHQGIEANLEKIQVLIDMQSPSKMKEVQSLTGRVAALSKFISRAQFLWDDKCEQAFGLFKEYLSKPPLLSKLSKANHYIYTLRSQSTRSQGPS